MARWSIGFRTSLSSLSMMICLRFSACVTQHRTAVIGSVAQCQQRAANHPMHPSRRVGALRQWKINRADRVIGNVELSQLARPLYVRLLPDAVSTLSSCVALTHLKDASRREAWLDELSGDGLECVHRRTAARSQQPDPGREVSGPLHERWADCRSSLDLTQAG